ncbi:MAG: thioesterase [Oscillibacter sp.]
MDCFNQRLTEDSFSRQEDLTFADCDRNKRARMATLLSMAATSAGHDYDARSLPYEQLYALRQIFLLSRVCLRLHRCPTAGERLTVTTWENGCGRAHVQRVFEWADGAGEVCVSARSEWILVNPETRKIMRPSAFTAKPITVCPKAIDCPACKKVLLPKEGLTQLGTRKIVWSDLDGNGHVYSGNYGDIVWDFLPADLQDRVPQTFYFNYSKEATLGEELTLTGLGEDACYRMEGVGAGGTCFTCEILF